MKINKGNVIIEHMDKDYSNVNKILKERGLIHSPSEALRPARVEVKGFSKHAEQRLLERGITKEEAQRYIDTALLMIKESRDKFEYIAEDGSSVVLEYGKLITVIPKEYYDERHSKILEVILEWLK